MREHRFLLAIVSVLFLALPLAAQFPVHPYDAYRGGPVAFDGKTNMGPYAWVSPGQLGGNFSRVVVGGQEGSTPLYVCRAPYVNGYHPGKYIGGRCNIGWGTSEHALTDNIQVLVNMLQTPNESLLLGFPQNWLGPETQLGFDGGTQDKLRVCRASYNNGLHPGKEWDNKCFIGWGGNAVPITPYQVLSLYNGVRLQAAITRQINSIGSDDKVRTTIELLTLVDYPGVLSHASFQMPQGFNLIRQSADSSACPNTPGSTCRQRWTYEIDPGFNCRLNGDYMAVFNKTCSGGGNPCGIGSQNVKLRLNSENFCSTTTVTTTQ
ncbi:MAG TPA: DM9 repeat-containing protein [Thermoanaerobaculia bacterium]